MIDEALVRSVVRGVLERMSSESLTPSVSPACHSEAVTNSTFPEAVNQLYHRYRERYLGVNPFDERFSTEFDTSLPLELGHPLFCIYETHLPCDSCGRCQVRGF
jgi:hypothetical protein